MTRTLVQQVMTTPVVTATEAMPFRDLARCYTPGTSGRCLWSRRPTSSQAWYHDLTSSRRRPGSPPDTRSVRGQYG